MRATKGVVGSRYAQRKVTRKRKVSDVLVPGHIKYNKQVFPEHDIHPSMKQIIQN